VARIRHRSEISSQRCRELHASSRVVQQSPTRCVDCPCCGTVKLDNASRTPPHGPEKGLGEPPSVTFPASSSTNGPRCGSLAQGRHVGPTSRRPCAAFFTNASRPGRLMGVTACQDRHEAPRAAATTPASVGRSSPARSDRAAYTAVLWARRSRVEERRALVLTVAHLEIDHPGGRRLESGRQDHLPPTMSSTT
jgi:hypothetical protein